MHKCSGGRCGDFVRFLEGYWRKWMTSKSVFELIDFEEGGTFEVNFGQILSILVITN